MGTSDLCVTPQCINAAANILGNLHPNWESLDPCDKFDECTSFVNN